MCGTECWWDLNTKTVGPEKLFAFVLFQLLMCMQNISNRQNISFRALSVRLTLYLTVDRYGAQGLTLSKIVPHICHLLGDPTSQVRDHVTVHIISLVLFIRKCVGVVVLWSWAPSAGENRNCQNAFKTFSFNS